ncbi:MAG TPA: hypothetical protein VGB36_02760 [Gammaproteobacteria bacterium]|jgi:hypothetical protein
MRVNHHGDFVRVFTHEEIERAVKRGRQLRSEAIHTSVSRLASRIRHGLLAGKFLGSVRGTEDTHPPESGALRSRVP